MPCLEEVLAAYLEEVDSGRAVSESDWLDRYPALRGELSEFFHSQRVLQSAVDQSSRSRASSGSLVDVTGARATDHSDCVDGYELIREIGRGGMGIVYEAHQPGLSRNVALKMLRNDGTASAEDLGRIRNEAELIARLSHPAIVAVHDMGSNQGQFWFTMQLIHGDNLAHFAKRYQTDPRDAVRVVKEISEAIEHAHRRGILHRDIKPGNILLDKEGQPHVTDFGLARRVDDNSSLTRTGSILGTPAYLAPEQLVDPRSVTTAADIYGLGAILYFLLTGRPPVVADSIIEAIDKVRNQPVAPPSGSNPLVSRDLDAVCRRCLEKRPEDRYGSAGELAMDLDRLLDGRPIEARAISTWEHVDRWRRRNPGLAWLTVSVIALSLLLLIGTTAAALMLARATRRARESLEQEIATKQELESEKRSTLQNLYEARKQQARAARFSGRPGQRVDAIAAVQEAAALIPPLRLPDSERLALRNTQIAALQLVDLVNDQPGKLGMVSPDGRCHLESETGWRALLITDVQSGQLRDRLVVSGRGKIDWHRPMCNWFSHTGRYLAARVIDDGTSVIQVWRIGTPTPILISDRATSRYTAQYAFSPDGNYVGFVIDSRLKVHRLPEGKEVITRMVPGIVGTSFAHNSSQVAAYGGGQIVILDFLTGETTHEFDTIEGVNVAKWTPDDGLLVGKLKKGNPGQNDLHLWNAASGAYRVLTGHSSNIEFFDLHPRGDMVVTSSWDGTVRFWSLCGSKQRMQLDGFCYPFNQGGCRLGIRTKNGVSQWRVDLPEEFRELMPPTVFDRDGKANTEHLQGVAVHPDGRLMVGGHFGALACWDLASGHGIAGAARPGANAQFSPDGRHLFTVGPNSGEVYEQSVEKEESDKQVTYIIGPPQLLEVASAGNDGIGPASQEGMIGHSGQIPVLPTFGTRWRSEDSSGEFFVYDMHRLCLIPVQGTRRQPNYPAVSPNGELLAVGNWLGPDTHVWDVRGGKLVKTLQSQQSRVAFSPDDQLLAVNEPGRCRVYEVHSWKRLYQSASEVSHTAARAVSFSPDGTMLAFDPGSRRDIRLLSMRDFQEIATLQLPEGKELVDHIDFSPDSSKVIEGSGDVVQIWDLCLIRERLGELDWDLPPFPPPKYDKFKSARVYFVPSADQEVSEASQVPRSK
jgi:serine/threonine protein kinase/WD40 repeat protein